MIKNNSSIFEQHIDDYIAFREGGKVHGCKWTDEYKWRILPKTHREFMSAKNILEVIDILRKNNPPSGSFVHWTGLDDLGKFASKNQKKVAMLFNLLLNERKDLAIRIDDFIKEGKKFKRDIKLGTPLFGYILAVSNYNKYPLFKDRVWQYIKEELGEKSWSSFSLGEKYRKFTEICTEMGKNLSERLNDRTVNDVDVKGGITALDGQDFFFALVEYWNHPRIGGDIAQQSYEEKYKEGAEKRFIQTTRERSPRLRVDAINKYGTKCLVCGFDSNKFYGEDIADGYIEVHHEKMLASTKGKHEVTINEVKVVCSNCHRIIHRKGEMLNWEKLRKTIENRKNNI